MPTRSYAFEKGSPKRLEISWDGHYRDIRIKLDGKEIGAIPSTTPLANGVSFNVPGSDDILSFGYDADFGRDGRLTIDLNGEPLPNSTGGLDQRSLELAPQILTGIGVISAISGIMNIATGQSNWTSVLQLIISAIVILSGVFAIKGHGACLIVGSALYIIDSILIVLLSLNPGHHLSTGVLATRIIFTAILARGIIAFKRM